MADGLLEAPILHLQLVQPLDRAPVQPLVLAFPAVEGVLTDAVAAQQISDLLAGLVGAEDLQDLGLREPTLLHAVLLALGSPEDSHIRWTSFRGAGHRSPPASRHAARPAIVRPSRRSLPDRGGGKLPHPARPGTIPQVPTPGDRVSASVPPQGQ